MRQTIFFAVLVLFSSNLTAQMPQGFTKSAKIYLVRHAEKDTGNNPVLTADGRKRAGDLMRVLKSKNIQRIYVTPYKRTQMTGDSMRLQLGIDTVLYKADTTGVDIYNTILARGDGNKTILIIGHSNTVPKIIKKLGGEDVPAVTIPDAVFDNLYLIKYKRKKAVLKSMKYGSPSGIAAPMQKS